MSEVGGPASLAEAPGEPYAGDVSGRDRLARNVLVSWGGYLVDVASGFVMPRLIDGAIGQVGLGIWDLAWSFVSYFGFVQVGVGASVNRFVAKRRGARDVAGLRRVVSSVVGLNLAAGVLVLGLTAGAIAVLPLFLRGEAAIHLESARWVVGLLGSSLALSFACDVFPGVITGCHRWEVHHLITATGSAFGLLGMLLALWLKGGLVGLALAQLASTALTEALRAFAAYRICPELRIRWADADLTQAWRMLAFGAKLSVGQLARLAVTQTNNLVIAGSLGPAALAVFARQLSLLRVSEVLSARLSFVLTPITSSLQGEGRERELRGLMLHATRLNTAVVTPIALTLVILADPIVEAWMGAGYAQGAVLAILVTGFYLASTQRPVAAMLAGLNLHGRVVAAYVSAAVLGIALVFLNDSYLRWGLPGAALAVAGPSLLCTGLFVPIFACLRLEIPLARFVREVYLTPVACNLPFAMVLLASRVTLAEQPLAAIAAGCGLGGSLLAALYWRLVIPPRWREAARSAVRGRLGLK